MNSSDEMTKALCSWEHCLDVQKGVRIVKALSQSVQFKTTVNTLKWANHLKQTFFNSKNYLIKIVTKW